MRAHAVEIFLRVTGDEALKWYVAPSTDDEVKMHRSLLDLGDRMIPDLVANARDSYPGGEKACLDLLAFWLGWARQMHCETHVLNPSRMLIEALSDWVRCDGHHGTRGRRVEVGADGPGGLRQQVALQHLVAGCNTGLAGQAAVGAVGAFGAIARLCECDVCSGGGF